MLGENEQNAASLSAATVPLQSSAPKEGHGEGTGIDSSKGHTANEPATGACSSQGSHEGVEEFKSNYEQSGDDSSWYSDADDGGEAA